MANDLKKPIEEWADEGHKLAVDFVYNIKQGETPSHLYTFYA